MTHGQDTQSDNVKCGMPFYPLYCTHKKTMLGVDCNYFHWKTNTVGRRQAWYAIMARGKETWSDDVGHGMPS